MRLLEGLSNEKFSREGAQPPPKTSPPAHPLDDSYNWYPHFLKQSYAPASKFNVSPDEPLTAPTGSTSVQTRQRLSSVDSTTSVDSTMSVD